MWVERKLALQHNSLFLLSNIAHKLQVLVMQIETMVPVPESKKWNLASCNSLDQTVESFSRESDSKPLWPQIDGLLDYIISLISVLSYLWSLRSLKFSILLETFKRFCLFHTNTYQNSCKERKSPISFPSILYFILSVLKCSEYK